VAALDVAVPGVGGTGTGAGGAGCWLLRPTLATTAVTIDARR
jgi:hypothetical protein